MQSLLAGKNFDRLTSEREDLSETEQIEYFFTLINYLHPIARNVLKIIVLFLTDSRYKSKWRFRD